MKRWRKRLSALLLSAALLLTMLCGGMLTASAEAEYTLGDEVLVNGDFEQGALRWSAEEGDLGSEWIKTGVGRDGSTGMELIGGEPDENGEVVQFYQGTIEVTPGNRYLLSFDYLANPGNTFYVRSGSLGCGKNTVTLGDDADGTWQTFTKEFVVPTTYTPRPDKGIGVYVTQVGVAPAVIDNVSLKVCALNVDPESAVLDRDEIILLAGRSQSLKVVSVPAKCNMNDTVWSTSNADVATVVGGTVTGVGEGTAVITMATYNGLRDTCTVTVVDKEATEADLVVDALEWTGGDGQVKPGTELTFTVTVTNQGTVDVTEAFDVDISAGTERVMRLTYEDGVKAGETVTITAESWEAVEGDHMMAVRVNPTLKVAEADDTNNTRQLNLRVAEERLTPTYNADEAAAAGMTNLTFSDDFDSLSVIDTLASGEEGYKWYITRPYAGTYLDPDDYSVEDGVLTVKNKNSLYNYGMATIDSKTGIGYTFNKGYLEFRLRIPNYDKEASGGPAVWSFPADKICETGATNYAKQWVEMDWMEYWGVSGQYPAGHWTISMHETIRGYADDGVTIDPNVKLANHSADNRHRDGLGDGDWHIISFLWTEHQMVAYLDGDECYRITYGEGEYSMPITMNAATEDGTGAFAYMDKQPLAMILGGSITNQMELDYVRIWQEGDGEPISDDESEDSPATGATSVLPTVCTALTAAAGLWISRKRK